ncbi:4-hydroxyproline epimerase [Bergeriella denitrificans]|uniref:4-hydroxyproline epimerase n=1 Tax=Bergeriella denitrificans TaxID=494 RepID=A0A378UJF9_BERDE|nr:4-hydroxyproline epimerase [Bergeriella denitrificans]STZ77425.1 4-hydroxyproline epimerase [Bergeriella denitrificans]
MTYQTFSVIDSHTGGEPTRVVYDGFPLSPGASAAEQRQHFEQHFDHLRRALILEPRGSDVWVGALLCPPQKPEAAAGVVFFNNAGYLGMCGHGTIGLMAALQYLGRIRPGVHLIETPVGDVRCELHEDGSVSVRNVPSYRAFRSVSLEVEGIGTVTGDVAWGGNWFFLIGNHGQRIAADNLDDLTGYARRVRRALNDSGIRGSDGGLIDHIELFAETDTADSRNFVLCPGNAYDRSPCGTGTSAKLACLAADGALPPGAPWVQESVIGSRFSAFYEEAGNGRIIPTLRGRAFIHADSRILLDAADPFRFGIETS